jgi:CheY-like chemotaxis protein
MTQPMNILLVQDHTDSAGVLAMLLRTEGHAVKIAGGVVAATQLAAQQPFDLLLCDLGLPDGSGLDLMRQLKSLYRMTGIALTSSAMDEDLAKRRDAGFHAHMSKPCAPEKLQSVLEALARTRAVTSSPAPCVELL